MTAPDLRATVTAVATPPGTGGLAVVRLSGPDARRIASRVFRGAPLRRVASHTLHVGRLVDPGRGRALDEVVAAVFRAPRSYTGEDVVEFSCHGGPAIAPAVVDLLCAQGACPAGPGEFTRRALLHGRLDLAQAEAVLDLVRAESDRARAAALLQLTGELSHEVRALRDRLRELRAECEAAVEFADDLPAADPRARADRLAAIDQLLARLVADGRRGRFLRSEARVVIVGRANVGKSSLFNRLLGSRRALVTPVAGTTRDVLEGRLLLGGHGLRLFDTAGHRRGRGLVERLGGIAARRQAAHADLLLAVFDASRPATAADRALARTARRRPHLWVLNKTDRPRRLAAGFLAGEETHSVSARTGQGLPGLRRALAALTGPDADCLVTNARHTAALVRARDAVRAARRAPVPEIAALELATADGALGEITGETSTPDILDRIFGQFCIGK